jgi:hypothetical protein
MNAKEELGKWLNDLEQMCLQAKMRPPFILCQIRPNGTVLALRLGLDAPVEKLVHHFVEGGNNYQHYCIVDQDNNFARVIFDESGPTLH